MINCGSCGKKIKQPDLQNRYCPYCGYAFVLPCQNSSCAVNDGVIISGKTSACPACGTIYRYNSSTREAVAVGVDGPFTAVGGDGEDRLVDLFASSGDPEALNCIAAREPVSYSSQLPGAFTLGSRTCRPQARHGRIYTIPQNGRVVALDCDKLELARGWSPQPLAAWQQESLASLEMQTSESVVYSLCRGHVTGFDAGTGALVFDLNAEDLKQAEALVSCDRLLVTGVKQNNEIIRIYSLSHLADQLEIRKTPLWEDIQPGLDTAGIYVPGERVYAVGPYFYVLTLSGNLQQVNRDGGIKQNLYTNFGRCSIHAWAVNAGRGVVVFAGKGSGSRYQIAAFSPIGDAPLDTPQNLYTIQPRSDLRRVLLVDDCVILLDDQGYLHKLQVDNPNLSGVNWPLLVGAKPLDVRDIMLVPAGDGNHTVVVHFREQLLHRFRYVKIGSGEMGDIPAQPPASDDVQAVFYGNCLFVCNLRDGRITPVML